MENAFVAGLFLCMANSGRCGKPTTRLDNDFAVRNNEYPYRLTAALTLLREFKGVSGAKRNKGANSNNNSSPHRVGVTMINATTNTWWRGSVLDVA